MKGVLLAGGQGTRLLPLTKVTNKHLLPVYDKPVIYYAIEKMVEAGIDRIMIVTSPHHLDDFVSLLGSGQNFLALKTGKQIQIVYGIQNTPSGIVDGLYIAKDYIGSDNCLLYLGDNIVEDSLAPAVKNFKDGATIFLKAVTEPRRFGIATVNNNGLVTAVIEKPENPTSNLAAIGAYIFD
ncbi:MAG: sugar phosphate nucleotidyltransferase, partial [Patescibacteria group bacterium]